ncbi:Mitochondrial calcium uniporter regulator 1 [Turdus rufiventris]|nr:Mitochondrial calcium uniporter regulator 1 [Turdus rufiventris]
MLPNSRVWSHLTTTFIAVIINVYKDWSCIWFSDKIQDSKKRHSSPLIMFMTYSGLTPVRPSSTGDPELDVLLQLYLPADPQFAREDKALIPFRPDDLKGFTTQQSEVIVSALVKIMNTNLDMIYKDMVTKVQQEIALQQVMSHIAGVKKDMIILEKSEFSALRSENEKIKLELQQIQKQVMDEITKVRADNKLNLNLEKSRVKELYSLNERKLLEMRTEIVELHAQQDRALTQTDRKIDTEVADLKTMLESHKLDNIKYLAVGFVKSTITYT